MILGYSTNAFINFSLSEAIKKIADLGFSGIEIMGDRPHLYPPDYTENKTGKLKKKIEENGLKITNINSFTLFAVGDTYLPSWIEPEPARREIRIQHTLDSIRIAAELECTNISVPPGGPLSDMPRSEAVSLFHQGLEKVIPLRSPEGAPFFSISSYSWPVSMVASSTALAMVAEQQINKGLTP